MNRWMKNIVLAVLSLGAAGASCDQDRLSEVHPVAVIGPDVCEVDAALAREGRTGEARQNEYIELTGLGCLELRKASNLSSFAPDLPGHGSTIQMISAREDGSCVLRFRNQIFVSKDGVSYPPTPIALTLALCMPHLDVDDARGLEELGGVLVAARAGTEDNLISLIDEPVPIVPRLRENSARCVVVPGSRVSLTEFSFVTEYELVFPEQSLPRLYGTRLHLAVREFIDDEQVP